MTRFTGSSLTMASLAAFAAFGISAPSFAVSGDSVNLVFSNRLTVDQHAVDPRFDPSAANPKLYDHLLVLTQTGRETYVDAAIHPLLFEAYWCPHCQRTLVLLAGRRSSMKAMPWIVSMGFPPGVTLSQAVKVTREELTAFHITGVQVYYWLNPFWQWLAPVSFPTLVFPGHGKMLSLAGEHTFDVWKRAMGFSSEQSRRAAPRSS